MCQSNSYCALNSLGGFCGRSLKCWPGKMKITSAEPIQSWFVCVSAVRRHCGREDDDCVPAQGILSTSRVFQLSLDQFCSVWSSVMPFLIFKWFWVRESGKEDTEDSSSTKLWHESAAFYWTLFLGGFQCCTWGALFASQIFWQARCPVIMHWQIRRHTGAPNQIISLSEHKELMQLTGQRAD